MCLYLEKKQLLSVFITIIIIIIFNLLGNKYIYICAFHFLYSF